MGIFDRFSKPPEIIRDRWNGYAYRFGQGERCIVSFDVRACDPAEQRPSQLRRVIGFSPEGEVSPSGMPSAAAMARLRAIEDALVGELTERRVKSWLVGRQVYRGFRELLFQVDDLDKFARAYAVVEAKFGGMKLVEHADWTFFNDKISPGERGHNHIGNREVIKALAEAGSDLSAPHRLDHTFLGAPGALESLVDELSDKGFSDASRHDGSVTLSNHATLDDQDEIDDMTTFLRELAATVGATYDGWGAAVVR